MARNVTALWISDAARVDDVVDRIRLVGTDTFGPFLIGARTVVLVVDADDGALAAMPGIAVVERDVGPWPLASRALSDESVVHIGGVTFGGANVAVIAGPCAVEDSDQASRVALAVCAAGAVALRGGAYKPRTSPYAHQGLGRAGLSLLAGARALTGLPVITEVLDPRDVAVVSDVADALQIGARNMQNTALLREAGRSGRPVLLKRSFGATAAELLHAAEYVLSAGGVGVVLCERGIRTFEPGARFTLDIGAVAWLKARSRLPVLVDPSHAAGTSELVVPLALAGLAAGADGLIVEVHDAPDDAISDGDQALSPAAFADLMRRASALCASLGRRLCTPHTTTQPAAALQGAAA